MSRRLVVCADRTWNTPDESSDVVRTPTNVSKLSRAILPVAADGTSQIVYYHEGVGTHFRLEHVKQRVNTRRLYQVKDARGTKVCSDTIAIEAPYQSVEVVCDSTTKHLGPAPDSTQ
jgi:type VI secretion system (T6SS) phospholipase Tle1-like effector